MSKELQLNQPLLAKRFEVLKILGKGSGSSVFQVRDRDHGGKEVALKVLTSEASFDGKALERFRNELEVCRTFKHPNLVEAFELIPLEDTFSFTMEYVNGTDLSKQLLYNPPAFDEIDRIFNQVLPALAELHRHGIVHRDIKLENVLVRKDGLVKLSDLGLLKKLDSEGLTQTGILLGTAQYLPPEYIKFSNFDIRGDIYAAGIMLYELLTRKRRLTGMPGMQAIEFLLKTKFVIPKIPDNSVPIKYRSILNRSLDPDPERRFQSAEEMRDAFQVAAHKSSRDLKLVGEKIGNPDSPSLLSRLFYVVVFLLMGILMAYLV